MTDDEGEERELKTLTVKLGSAGREINTDELYKAVLTAYADANFEMQYVVEETCRRPLTSTACTTSIMLRR